MLRRMDDRLAILILAAGAARRMGRDKLLLPVRGRPMLRHVALTALEAARKGGETGGSGESRERPVIVTLGAAHPARRAALSDLDLAIVEVADAAEGMGASLRAGIAALPEGTGAVLVMLADMPAITAADLTRMIAAHARAPGLILRAASADGRPGNPVLIPLSFLRDFPLAGDRGARDLLARHAASLRLVPLAGDHALRDIDTEADWAAWKDPDRI